MPRRLKWARSALTFNTLNTVLTAPAATKFEVVGFTLVTDGTTAVNCLLFNQAGATYTGLDQFSVATTKPIEYRNYEALVLAPGESFVIFPVSGASLTEYCVMQYVEVAPA